MIFATPELDARELEVLAEVERLRGELRYQLREPRRWTGSLRRMQMALAVQASNSIEGYVADLDDVAALGRGSSAMSASDATVDALRGYQAAMTWVLQLADDEDFSYHPQLLKGLHFMVAGHDLAARPGRWRSGSVYVHEAGSGAVVYEGPPAEQVPGLMAELLDGLEAEQGEPLLVRAAMAHLNLVMVHPFKDGNGRMGRCLQSLVLARGRLLAPELGSIEEYLGAHTRRYYEVLAEVGGGSWQPQRDARPWLRLALTAHLEQVRTLLTRTREGEALWLGIEEAVEARGLPARVIPALWDAAKGYRIRNSTYRAAAASGLGAELSENLASRDLAELVRAGLLVAVGERRGRHYVAAGDLVAVARAVATRSPSSEAADPFAS